MKTVGHFVRHTREQEEKIAKMSQSTNKQATQQMDRLAVELNHFKSSDYRNFYEPSDDTWLFTDGLEKDVSFIVSMLSSTCTTATTEEEEQRSTLNVSVEVGSGSGYVTTFLMKLLMRHDLCHNALVMNQMFFFCTDINPHATSATFQTLKHNGVPMSHVDVVQTSFTSALMPRNRNKARILLFNPPYVPSEEDELGHDDCHAAYAGGRDGREVIDEFLPLVKHILTHKNSVCYMIAIEDNKPRELMEIMSREKYGSFQSSVVMKKKVLGEILYLLKFVR